MLDLRPACSTPGCPNLPMGHGYQWCHDCHLVYMRRWHEARKREEQKLNKGTPDE